MELQSSDLDSLHVFSNDRAPSAAGGGAGAGGRFESSAKHIHTRVGAAIRRRRRAIDITLHQLSLACGVSFQQVQKYESGASAISAATLWNLACALKVPIAYFYDGDPQTDD